MKQVEWLGRIFRRRRRTGGVGRAGYLVAGLMLLGFFAIRAWDPAPVEGLRMRVFDTYQRIQPRQPGASPVAIVDIDEKSLAELGQWPWPRTVLARLVERLTRLGAVVIAFDVLFAEPDRTSPGILAERLTGLDPAARRALRGQPTNEAVFAAAMRRSRVVLAQAALPTPRTASQSRPVPKAALAQVGGDPRRFILTYGGAIRGMPELEKAARGIGDITLSPEADGVVRRVPLMVNINGRIFPTLALEALRVATGQSAFAVRSDAAGVTAVVVAGVSIPTDRNARKWVYFSESSAARYIPAADVLAGRTPRGRIAGKLVFVGTSATGLRDIRITPLSPSLPGVEIHAQLLENVLGKTGLIRPNYALGAELLLLVAAGLFVILLTPWVGARATLALGAVLTGGLIGGSWHLFSSAGILLDISYAAVASLAIYAAVTFVKYMREEAERRKVRTAFSHYLSPELVDRLAEHPDQLKLGGEARDMTIMFSDVRGFTAMSERMSPEDLTRLVNLILTRMTDAVLAHGGTIDKYIGDCMMAFWNAPLLSESYDRDAGLAALDIITAIGALNEELVETWPDTSGPVPKVAVGVGLNTGRCLVGNMGSTHRFNYSVLGDPVNLSARLESQTVYYGCPIVLGEDTAVAVPELACLELDLIRVKGKSRPARVFALLGNEAVRGGSAFSELTEAHDAMLAAYRSRDWGEAGRRLDTCRARRGAFPLSRLYELYEARIGDFRAEEPEAGWDGVYVAAEK